MRAAKILVILMVDSSSFHAQRCGLWDQDSGLLCLFPSRGLNQALSEKYFSYGKIPGLCSFMQPVKKEERNSESSRPVAGHRDRTGNHPIPAPPDDIPRNRECLHLVVRTIHANRYQRSRRNPECTIPEKRQHCDRGYPAFLKNRRSPSGNRETFPATAFRSQGESARASGKGNPGIVLRDVGGLS